FRQVYASVLGQWFGVSQSSLRAILQREFAQLPITSVSSVSEAETGKPSRFELSQNYPNPFNPTTTIRYQLPVASEVSLKVFDMLGREVATLVQARQAAGVYQVHFNASGLASGTYLYRLQTPTFAETKKMTLLK
ncbi:MAG: T9SS type A sorting domain-containing protein, partial [Chloroherpetonaceae bacterium]|nr:T9SS type A sorting domain-containing protein [Chloroherpetonaceae bacterium]